MIVIHHVIRMNIRWLLLFSLLQGVVLAKPNDSTSIMSQVSIAFDYLKLAELALSDGYKYEGEVGAMWFGQIYLTGEVGMASIVPNRTYKNATRYESVGQYGRIGLDYKVQFINIPPGNDLLIGLRYGQSMFSDKGSYRLDSELGGSLEQDFGGDDLGANWLEFVLTTQATIIKNLYLGGKFRLRVLLDYDERMPIDVYAIPGYGRAFDKTVPAFNLFVKYVLNFK